MADPIPTVARRQVTKAWWSAALVAIAALATVVFVVLSAPSTQDGAPVLAHDVAMNEQAATQADKAQVAATRATLLAQHAAEGAARATEVAAESAAAQTPVTARAVTDAAYEASASEPAATN